MPQRTLLYVKCPFRAVFLCSPLQIFIPQGVDWIILLKLPDRVKHRGKYYQKNAAYCDDDAVPWHIKAALHGSFCHSENKIRNENGYRQTIQDPLQPVKDTFIIHHFVEALLRHSYRFQHCKLSPSEPDVR